MKFKYIVILTILLYLLQMSFYIMTAAKIPADTQFEIIAAKGDYGITEDYLKFATQMKSYVQNGNFFIQTDAYDPSRGNIATGALGLSAAGLPYLFSDNAMLPWLLMPLLSTFLIVFMLGKIFERMFSSQLNRLQISLITILVSLLLIITGGDVLLSWKLLISPPEGMRFLGYVGRFPSIQFTLVFPIFWLYALIEFSRKSTWINAIVLSIALVAIQYSYFYFFSSAFLFTAIYAALNWRLIIASWKKVLVILGITALLVAPYWYNFICFNASDFGAEYAVRVGRDTTSASWMYGKTLILLFIVFVAIDSLYLRKIEGVEWKRIPVSILSFSSITIALYVSIFLLMNIQVLVGYTVQPYHWVETCFKPILCLPAGIAIGRLYQLLKNTKVQHALSVGVGIISILIIGLIGLGGASNASNYWKDYMYVTKSEKEVIGAIKQAKGSTIFSNSINAMLFYSIHTSKKPFVPDAFMTTMPNDSIIKYMVEGLKVCSYNEEQVLDEFNILTEEGHPDKSISENFRRKYVDTPGQILGNTSLLWYVAHATYYDRSKNRYQLELAKPTITKAYIDPVAHIPDLLLIRLRNVVSDFSIDKIGGDIIFKNNEYILFQLNK